MTYVATAALLLLLAGCCTAHERALDEAAFSNELCHHQLDECRGHP